MTCVDETVLIEKRIDRVLTQYRESPKLLFMIRTYLSQIANIYSAICDMPEYFSLYTAVGDQLTKIGKRMGFPRCHCVCDVQPVFGFECTGDSPLEQIIGFCEGASWEGCGQDGIAEICITDDEMYRKLLISRSYQMQSRYSYDDLTSALQAIFGPTAKILSQGHGRVILTPGRDLTDLEVGLLQVIPRVLPVAPGIVTRWHFGLGPIFGFGEGWSGFCLPWEDWTYLVTEDEDVMVTEDGDAIVTGPMTRDSDWMCQIDLKPYSC